MQTNKRTRYNHREENKIQNMQNISPLPNNVTEITENKAILKTLPNSVPEMAWHKVIN
jgi:hypothetical protein